MTNQSKIIIGLLFGLTPFVSGCSNAFQTVSKSPPSLQNDGQSSSGGVGQPGGGSSTGGGTGGTDGGSTGGSSGGITDFKLSCEEAQFIKYLNIYRQSLGLGTVRVSKSAVLAARFHAQDMIDKNYFDHYEPSGRDPFTRMRSFGYPGLSENASYGSLTRNSFCGWKTSPGHDENMRGPSYVSTGIGRAVTTTKFAFWSSNFGGPVSDYLAEPLTSDAGCVLPTQLPNCGG